MKRHPRTSLTQRGQQGGVLPEYALLASLIAVVCVLAILGVGQETRGLFVNACNVISAATNGALGC